MMNRKIFRKLGAGSVVSTATCKQADSSVSDSAPRSEQSRLGLQRSRSLDVASFDSHATWRTSARSDRSDHAESVQRGSDVRSSVCLSSLWGIYSARVASGSDRSDPGLRGRSVCGRAVAATFVLRLVKCKSLSSRGSLGDERHYGTYTCTQSRSVGREA